MENLNKNFMNALICASLFIFPLQKAMAHDPESRVALEPETTVTTSGKTIYKFQIVDTKLNKLLNDTDLQISHEKKLHMLAYDPALKEFQHVHPEYDGKLWVAELNFSINGNYWVWAQGALAVDGAEFSGSNRLLVSGGNAAWPIPPALVENRIGVDGVSQVELAKTKITAGKALMLTVRFSRTDGSSVKIEPYLGAFAHVVAVPDDGDSLIHVHPMAGANPNEGMIHTTFPEAGNYRIWIQFIDGGVLKVIPLSLVVNK